MTNQQQPITPPPEMVQQWIRERDGLEHLATQAAQWGADQELEACAKWVAEHISSPEAAELRTARRPKSLSLKEQALQVLASAPGLDYPRVMTMLNADEHALIRQALKALPND